MKKNKLPFSLIIFGLISSLSIPLYKINYIEKEIKEEKLPIIDPESKKKIISNNSPLEKPPERILW